MYSHLTTDSASIHVFRKDSVISNLPEHSVYHIEVKNPDNVQKGVKKVNVDGKEHEGCLIPFEEGKKEYHVTVYMG